MRDEFYSLDTLLEMEQRAAGANTYWQYVYEIVLLRRGLATEENQ